MIQETKISIIAAASLNNVIGLDEKIPWYISDDLKRFKQLTSGHHIIMGRKTFESLNSKPLPNRVNIIISSNKDIKSISPIIIVQNLESALLKATPDKEVFIIGGGQVYRDAMRYANRIYLTRIDSEIEGNIFFPEINSKEWRLTNAEGKFIDEKSQLAYQYLTYDRITFPN